MARYVELDGDWARRHPVKLEQVSMYVFVLGADITALEMVCDSMFDGPSNSTVTAKPLLPGVLLVCADIQKVRSDAPEDKPKGFLVERDVGLFVPVTVQNAGQSWHAAIVPYLFVDNMAGVIGGRELYGFPKELATITFPLPIEAKSQVLRQYLTTEPAAPRLVVKVEAVGPVLRTGLPGTVLDTTAAIATAIVQALGSNPPAAVPGFDRVPLLFLKQFRDAVNPNVACHQSIVGADGSIDGLRSADLLGGAFEVTLPRYDSLRIADKLALTAPLPGADPRFQALGGFALDLDVTVSLGRSLWTAP